MKPVRFRVHDRHVDGRYFEVRVFDTRDEMLADAERLKPGENNEDAEALCMPLCWISIQPDGTAVESRRQGFLMFHRQRLGTQVVTHEVVHAACDLWRNRDGGRVALGTECDDVEERFAHLVSDLSRMLVDKLYDRGVYADV